MLPFSAVTRSTILFTFIAAAFPAFAQTQPDVAILATVHAKELRFTEVPQVSVTFPGQENNQTVWHTDRENLPSPVQPYVIYRDIGIRLTISSTLPNIEQIVDEALAPEPAPAPAKAKLKTRSSRR